MTQAAPGGHGAMVDVIVTERGIAIDPQLRELADAVRGSSLPIRPQTAIEAEVEEICGGKPAPAEVGERVVAAIKWVDGTVIDCVREVRG